MSDFSEATNGKWRSILLNLGMEERYLTGRHTDCPMCGGRDRFRFTDHEGGGIFICNQCGPGNGWTLAKHVSGKRERQLAHEILLMVGSITEEKKPIFVDDFEKNRQRLLSVMQGCVVSELSPVRKYLKSRHLNQSSNLYFHPSLAYWQDGKVIGKFPAMVAKVVTPQNAVASLHVTYLNQSGQKADVESPRKIMPKCRPLAGSAIRLCAGEKVMGIAEGIETALSVTAMNGIPCWSAINAGLLEKFEPPDYVEQLYIFADCDYSYTGEAAAYALAKRLSNRIDVIVRVPEKRGTDWADYWEEKNGKSTLGSKL